MYISILKRLFFVAVVIASKFNDDFRLSNKDFCKIGGINEQELFVLEMEFLKILKFELKTTSDEFLEEVRKSFNWFYLNVI